ncbi:hypothetical protein [Gordonia malaquae]|uniref:hypothetical protein n=1 Tax=Gordonia malaquae TaxID=410332 RepID=UPI0030160873
MTARGKTARRPTSTCKRCHRPVAWWRSSTREGGWICVDASPDDAGTVQRVPSREGGRPVMYGLVLSGLELAAAVADGELLFTIHSKTCPAGRPRNPRPAGLAPTERP